MTNTSVLMQYINDKGLKLSYVAEYIGLSRQGFANKIRNVHPFNTDEVDKLCDLLGIKSAADIKRIFFAQKVDK